MHYDMFSWSKIIYAKIESRAEISTFWTLKRAVFLLDLNGKGAFFCGDLISVLRYVSKIILVYLHVFLYVI